MAAGLSRRERCPSLATPGWRQRERRRQSAPPGPASSNDAPGRKSLLDLAVECPKHHDIQRTEICYRGFGGRFRVPCVGVGRGSVFVQRPAPPPDRGDGKLLE